MSIKITAVTKLKHAQLNQAAKDFGSASALARFLGVSPQTIGQWINLQKCPPLFPTTAWSEQRIADLEIDLFLITGETMEELFPGELREADEFLNRPKKLEQTREIEGYALAHYAENTQRRLEDNASLGTEHSRIVQEDQELVDCLLRQLTQREGNVIKALWGLEGKEMPQSEVAKSLKVTSSRVGHIHQKALYKLRMIARDLRFKGRSMQVEVPRRLLEIV